MIHLPARVVVRGAEMAIVIALAVATVAPSGAAKSTANARASAQRSHAAAASPQLDSLVQARSLRRWALAESLATRILARANTEAHPDTGVMAAAHEAIAESHWSRRANAVGDDVAVRNALQGVAYYDRLAPASPSRIRLRVIAAAYLIESQLPDSALGLLRVAESLPTAGDSVAAEIHFWKGRAFRGLGRPGVMGEIGTAYEMMSRALGPTHMRVVELLGQKGVTATALGEYDVAREDLGRAREILERNPTANARQLGAIYGDLSTLERNLGNLGESIDYAHRALQLARTTQGDSSLSVGRIRAMLGLRYLLVSDLRAAEREFALCVPLLARHMGAKSFMTVNNRLYLSYVRFTMGDTAGSVAAFDSLRHVMELEPERHLWNLSFCNTLMAQAIDTPGRMSEARQLSKRAYELIPVSQDSRGTARAEALINLFDETDLAPDRAFVDSLGLALERLADSTGLRRNSVYRSVSLSRARAEARAGATDAAWTHALANEAQARTRLMADIRALPDSRALELSNSFGGALDVLVWLAADAPAGRADVAWDRLVRWRGVVRDEMARLRPPLAADSSAREAQQEWGAAQRRYARLVVAGFTERDDAASREAVETARSAAEEAERVYVFQSGRGAAPAPDSLDLKAVLASLGQNEALVSFAQTNIGRNRERVAAFVATGSRRDARCIDLGPASELRSVISRWREQLATSPVASGRKPAVAERECRRAGEIVRQRVWDPIAAAVEGATAVDIVGDGPLLDVPWLALPDGREGYLVDGKLAVRVLEAERDRLRPAAAEHAGALLAVGDPDFDALRGGVRVASNEVAVRSALPECLGDGMRFGRLPAARLEVEDLAGLWRATGADARTLIDAAATESAVKRDAPGNTVLHLATHGVMLLDTCGTSVAGTRGVGGVGSIDVKPTPRRSKRKVSTAAAVPAAPTPAASTAWFGRRVLLALAGASQPPSESLDENDGWLTAEEVVTLDLRGLDWVVLSACHSGAAVAWSREGALGMRRAFELAGARTVIASLWAVEDEATRQWMRELYLARSQGAAGAAEAIRRANRSVLESRRKRHLTTHPFYWAGFTATGG